MLTLTNALTHAKKKKSGKQTNSFCLPNLLNNMRMSDIQFILFEITKNGTRDWNGM